MKHAEIRALLPAIFQQAARDGSPLDVLLDVMEQLHAPAEDVLAGLDRYFDPRRAPDAFVAFLATWVDLRELLRAVPTDASDGALREPLATGTGRLRELVAAAAYLSQWRGTNRGLQRFLETATGRSGFVIDEQVTDPRTGRVRPYHIHVHAPGDTEAVRPLLEKIIVMEKPAYVTFELSFDAD